MKRELTTINYQKTYSLGQDYKAIKDRAVKVLGAGSGDTVDFNDVSREVTFRSERLIPSHKERPSVILLFSNPHPHSIRQGMFLSPNTKNPYGGRRVKNKEEIIRTLLGNEWPCLHSPLGECRQGLSLAGPGSLLVFPYSHWLSVSRCCVS